MGRLTTHVLDTANGRPGAGIAVRLFALGADRELIASAVTNADGRTDEPLLQGDAFRSGCYELEFRIGDYFGPAGRDEPPFLDVVVVRCNLRGDEHYHVPLLASPWSYSTYRGS